MTTYTYPDAYGLCSCGACCCWRGGTGPDGWCDECRDGQHGTSSSRQNSYRLGRVQQ